MTHPDIACRWLIRRDFEEVFAIENASFADPWDEEDFLVLLRQKNAIAMVAETWEQDRERIVGFVCWTLHKKTLRLENLAVDPAYRGIGIGRAMVDRLRDKLSAQRRNSLELVLRESNLDAQLFFRALGFRCNETLRNWYDDTGEDGLFFEWFYAAEYSEELTGRRR